jgi:hypothetical protein
MFALHSSMSPLDYTTEPSFECGDNDLGDVAFVYVTGLIGGRDTIKEYLACRMFPLLANFGFAEILDGETLVSKMVVPLPGFPLTRFEGESNDCLLARVELEAKNVVGGYTRVEHDACIKVLQNRGHLNRVFERAGVSYAPRPPPGTDASVKAAKKRKVDACDRPTGKHTKVVGRKEMAMAPKAVAATPKVVSGVVPKGATTLKFGVAALKTIAVASKATATTQKRAPVMTKVMTLNV